MGLQITGGVNLGSGSKGLSVLGQQLVRPVLLDWLQSDALEYRDLSLRTNLNRAYTISTGAWFFIFNIADPANLSIPSKLRNVVAATSFTGACCIDNLSTTKCVIGSSQGRVIVIDTASDVISITGAVSNPTVGGTQDALLGVTDLKVVDDRWVYVAAPTGNALGVVDLLDPANPAVVAKLTHANIAGPSFVVRNGNYLYIGNTNSKIVVVDITTRDAPSVVGSGTDSVVPSWGSLGDDGYLYTVTTGATNRMAVWSLSSPTSPTVVGSLTDSRFDRCLGVSVVNGVATICSQSDSGIVAYVDVRTPATPKYVTRLLQPTAGGPGDVGSGELYHIFSSTRSGGIDYIANAGAGGLTTVRINRIT